MNPVNLTFDILNPKSIETDHHLKFEGSAINGSQDIEWKPIWILWPWPLTYWTQNQLGSCPHRDQPPCEIWRLWDKWLARYWVETNCDGRWTTRGTDYLMDEWTWQKQYVSPKLGGDIMKILPGVKEIWSRHEIQGSNLWPSTVTLTLGGHGWVMGSAHHLTQANIWPKSYDSRSALQWEINKIPANSMKYQVFKLCIMPSCSV